MESGPVKVAYREDSHVLESEGRQVRTYVNIDSQ